MKAALLRSGSCDWCGGDEGGEAEAVYGGGAGRGVGEAGCGPVDTTGDVVWRGGEPWVLLRSMVRVSTAVEC